jgi:hypothetical protein
MGPACYLSLPPCTDRPRPPRCQIPPRSASLRRPAPRLEWSPSRLNLPRHQGPSLNPLNLTSSSMALKPITSPVTTPATPPRRSLGPYKSRRAPPALTALFPLSPELPRAFLRPRAKLKLPPFFTSVAPPIHHRSCFGEHLSGATSFGSSSTIAAGEHRRALVPAHRSLARCRPVHKPWTRSTGFSIGK